MRTTDQLTDLRNLVAHLDELNDRDISIHSGFMGRPRARYPDIAPVRAL